jgi:V/A-type H+-transporting ATPase subunit D
MKIKTSPNRMNLLKLRKRLKFALRGHKLLKDKQEQLSKEFNSIIVELLQLRKEIDKLSQEIFSYIEQVNKYKPKQSLETFFDLLNKYFNIETKFVLSTRFNIKYNEVKLEYKKQLSVPIFDSDPYLNFISTKILKFYELIIQLVNTETLCEIIANELQRTRRRVNALEYVLIPQIKDSIRFIINKLNEFERTNITQLMHIKQKIVSIEK